MQKLNQPLRHVQHATVFACDALAHSLNCAYSNDALLLVKIDQACDEIKPLVDLVAPEGSDSSDCRLIHQALLQAADDLRWHRAELSDAQCEAMESLSGVLKNQARVQPDSSTDEVFVSKYPLAPSCHTGYSHRFVTRSANQAQFAAPAAETQASELLGDVVHDMKVVAAYSRQAMFEIGRLAVMAGFERKPWDWSGFIGYTVYVEFASWVESTATELEKLLKSARTGSSASSLRSI